MKKLLLACALLFTTCIGATAQGTNSNVFWVGTARDTAKPNTTKIQSISIKSQGGVTIAYNLTNLTDTTTGYVSVWAGIDDTTYVPYPGADSVAIAAHSPVNKMWFLNTKVNGNPVRGIQVRTRCPSNTTNSTGKAKVTTKAFIY